MLAWLSSGTLAAALAAADPFPTPHQASEPQAGLSAPRLLNGTHRPLKIQVQAPQTAVDIRLKLMAFDGTSLADSFAVARGEVDLAEHLPAIWDLQQTAYLQLIVDNEPLASALVIQPLLSRLVPQTEIALRPDNITPYTKVIGWLDENQLPPPAPPRPIDNQPAAPAAEPQNIDNKDADDPENAAQPIPAAAAPRLCTGLRVYPEVDVILHTEEGDIRLALCPHEAPNTVWNFLTLCRDGFYDDVGFHRVVRLDRNGNPFVIQGGDPTGTGDGGPGYWLPLEDSHLPHDFGVISMARSDHPDSNGSQFFICLSREGTARLDGQYCSFGYAVDGVDAIRDIADAELADVTTGRPVHPPVIGSTQLVPAPARRPGQGRPDSRISPERKEPDRPRFVPR